MAISNEEQSAAAVRDYLTRQPDWRYRLAVQYANWRGRKRPLQCPLVDQCVDLIRQANQDPNSPKRVRRSPSRHSLSQLQTAYELYSRTGYIELKQELEARILAKQTNPQIAFATGLPEEVCELYEQVFFNVRHRLDGSYYIMGEVIACSLLDEVDPKKSSQQSLYRLAYCLGGVGLEEILAVRRLLRNNSVVAYREVIRQQLMSNPKLLRLLTAERLPHVGIAAHAILANLLGAPLDLPPTEAASVVVSKDATSVAAETDSPLPDLRAAG